MGIRDYLKEYVVPYDAKAGWKVGDKAITTREAKFGDFTVPAGAEVTIDSVPESRHGGDAYALGSFTWNGKVGCEAALSPETAKHHFGEDGPCVVRSPTRSGERVGDNECWDPGTCSTCLSGRRH